jgi:type IV fimbrial biogenesis protein FimT
MRAIDSQRRQRGFTLLELLVTLMIVAILATLAAPSIGSMITESRYQQTRHQLHNAYLYARSEAVKRETNINLTLEDNQLIVRRASDNTEFRRFQLDLTGLQMQASTPLEITPLGTTTAIRWQLAGPAQSHSCLVVLSSGQSSLQDESCA